MNKSFVYSKFIIDKFYVWIPGGDGTADELVLAVGQL